MAKLLFDRSSDAPEAMPSELSLLEPPAWFGVLLVLIDTVPAETVRLAAWIPSNRTLPAPVLVIARPAAESRASRGLKWQ